MCFGELAQDFQSLLFAPVFLGILNGLFRIRSVKLTQQFHRRKQTAIKQAGRYLALHLLHHFLIILNRDLCVVVVCGHLVHHIRADIHHARHVVVI